ncbi:MAG: tetraacyldisaccharide 4'-kinase [Cardiobacteriaceae bacterium]|nr:tetraacyldisaccharide 4'-kinase [Cardiobacteriaceae bacterium]
MSDIPGFWRRRGWLAWLLAPFALLFGLMVWLRRRWLRGKARALPVPLVVVGNISVGGNGKTPVVMALVRALRARGWQVGVVSGGYGGAARKAGAVCAVTAESDAAWVGDEPLLLARETGVPLWIGRERRAAAEALLAAHPGVQVIVADDGLQHYRLPRQVEWVVMAADLGVGNGWLLPAGPLREGVARVREADALLVVGDGAAADGVASGSVPRYRLRAEALAARWLCDGSVYPIGEEALFVLTAIARGERVTAGVQAAGGVVADARYLPDHAAIPPQAADFAGAQGRIVVTGKDAVKLDGWPEALRARVVVLDYRLVLPEALLTTLEGRLQRSA